MPSWNGCLFEEREVSRIFDIGHWIHINLINLTRIRRMQYHAPRCNFPESLKKASSAYLGRDKMTTIMQTTFRMHFLEWNLLDFYSNFTNGILSIMRESSVMQTIFCKRYFQMHFLECNLLDFYSNFTEVNSWGPINNMPPLVQIIAWHLAGDKPLSEPLLVLFACLHIYDVYMRHSASMT